MIGSVTLQEYVNWMLMKSVPLQIGANVSSYYSIWSSISIENSFGTGHIFPFIWTFEGY